MRSFDVQSAIDERAARAEFSRAQTESERALLSPRIGQLVAEADAAVARADASRASAEATRKTLQPEIDKINSETERNKAMTETERQTLGLKKQELQARIIASNAEAQSAGDTSALRREQIESERQERLQKNELFPFARDKARRESEAFTTFTHPDTGEKFTISSGQMMDYLQGDKATQAALGRHLIEQQNRRADDKRQETNMVRDAESRILTTGKKQREYEADLNQFHQYSEDPYVYMWKSVSFGKDKYEKVELPKINGKQLTARDIFEHAGSLGVERYMREIVYKGKDPFKVY